MNYELLTPEIHLLKVALATIGAFIMCSLSACGISTSTGPQGGLVIGTTSYLETYNKSAEITHLEPSIEDKRKLSAMIERRF